MRRSLYFVTVVSVIFLGVALLSGYLAFRNWPRNAIRQADRGFENARRNIDPEKLRAWALSLVSNFPPTNTSYGVRELPGHRVPKSVEDIYRTTPRVSIFGARDEVGEHVMLMWGGGHFNWALLIGQTNLPMRTDSNRFTNVKWVPGIYYRRDGNLPTP